MHENDTTKGNRITIFKRYIIKSSFPKTKDKSYQTVPRLTVNGTVRIPFDLPRLLFEKNLSSIYCSYKSYEYRGNPIAGSVTSL